MTYRGGVDEVVVVFPSGRSVTIKSGATVELPPEDAEALNGHPDWSPEEGAK